MGRAGSFRRLREAPLPLPAPGVPCGCVVPVSASAVLCLLLGGLLQGHLSLDSGPPESRMTSSGSLSWIVSAKALFLNEVALTASEGEEVGVFWGHHSATALEKDTCAGRGA